MVRKRPLFLHEIKGGEFDAVTALEGEAVVHNCKMHPNMRGRAIHHHSFLYDGVLGEDATNDEVYGKTAAGLVASTLAGSYGTVMMYGQTGSGT
ncbi:unnamed protein product, partial [Chrysoparadoxa australica]